MQANNGRFLLGMEWRYWQGQRGKLLFLLVGFALMCALLTLLLRLGDVLFNEPPAWAEPEGYVYTFAREHADGRLSPLHQLALHRIEEAPGVRAQTSFMANTTTFGFSGFPEEALQSLYFADNFADLLGIPELLSATEPGVWLSERYFREHWQGTPDVLNSSLQHSRIPSSLPILGVLPAKYNRIGNIQPDIWLNDSYYAYLTPFTTSSAQQVERFLLAAPNRYGILFSDQPLSTDALNEYLSRQDLSVPGMTMRGDGSEFVIHSGINLDPLAKQRLLQQWQLLLVLIVAFVIVLSLNTLSMFTSRLLQQSNNYRIQRILGASAPQLLQGSLYSSALMIACVGVSSLLLLWVFNYAISQQAAYLETVGNAGLDTNFLQWFAALGLVAILLILCGCLPMLRITRQPLFGRQAGESRSKGQKLLAQVNLSSQLLIALIAISFLSTLGYQQWQLFKSYELDSSAQSFSVRQLSSGFDVSALMEGNLPQINAGEVAFASSVFTETRVSELDDSRMAEPVPVQERIVSGNYFEQLGTPILGLAGDWEQDIVINQSLATLLEYNTSTPIIGSSLDLGVRGNFQIKGIVSDLPHQGFTQTSTPALYLHHGSAAFTMQTIKELEFYYDESDAERLHLALQRWLEDSTQQPQFSEQTQVSALIAQQDSASRGLLLFCAIMIVLVVSIVFTSLRYQIRNRMVLERQEYGVLLAIGAPDWRLFWRASYQAMGAFVVAIPLAIIALAWLLNDNGWLSSFALAFSAPLFIFGVLLLLLLTLIAAQLPVWQLFRESIFSLLRTN